MGILGTLIMISILALLIVSIFLIVKHYKKNLKLVLLPIIGIPILYLTILLIDINRINSFHKPLFVWKPTVDLATNEISYQGIGYKVIVQYSEYVKVEAITMYMFDKVIAASIK